MNRILNRIDWMLQHHPFISMALLVLLMGNVTTIADFLVPPP